ncbi:MAG TPA: ATP-dependent helicase C-terminal domain-containing protein, partial [Acetobacteraceae bacterium]|nr:ATP-dependent helicase C-terminal domain-containing protein [Acetobacteraceae bacterium]
NVTREVAIEPASGAVTVRVRERLGALVLSDRAEKASAAEAEVAIRAAVAAKPEQLAWNEDIRQLQARVALMRGIEPDRWPDFSDAALRATLDDWLGPHLAGLRSLAEARALDLFSILRGLLGWSDASRLDQELPPKVDLPAGYASIDYTAPVPVATARAQLFYGLDETPKLAGGRVPLQLSLLSPAARPIAITADLAGFWRQGWADARREARGRYPKHDWPEEPWLSPWTREKK